MPVPLEYTKLESFIDDGGIRRTIVTIIGSFGMLGNFVVRVRRGHVGLGGTGVSHLSIVSLYGYTVALWDGEWVKVPDDMCQVASLLVHFGDFDCL